MAAQLLGGSHHCWHTLRTQRKAEGALVGGRRHRGRHAAGRPNRLMHRLAHELERCGCATLGRRGAQRACCRGHHVSKPLPGQPQHRRRAWCHAPLLPCCFPRSARRVVCWRWQAGQQLHAGQRLGHSILQHTRTRSSKGWSMDSNWTGAHGLSAGHGPSFVTAMPRRASSAAAQFVQAVLRLATATQCIPPCPLAWN